MMIHAYLSRTPGSSAGDRRTWTWSGWVKRGVLGSVQETIFGAGNGGSIFDEVKHSFIFI